MEWGECVAFAAPRSVEPINLAVSAMSAMPFILYSHWKSGAFLQMIPALPSALASVLGTGAKLHSHGSLAQVSRTNSADALSTI